MILQTKPKKQTKIVLSFSTGVPVVNFNAQRCYSMETEGHIRGQFHVPADHIDNGGRLIAFHMDSIYAFIRGR